MSRDSQLRGLGRIARLKADLELRRFSLLRAQVVGLDGRIADLAAEMESVADGAVQTWNPAGTAPAETHARNAGSEAATSAVRERPAGETRPAARSDMMLNAMRLANALTRAASLESEAVAAERARLAPQFKEASTRARHAFGRAEAVDALRRRMAEERRRKSDRRA